MCLCLLVKGLDADGLIVVAELLAEKRAAAAVGSVLRHFDAEGKQTVVINIQLFYGQAGEPLPPSI